MPELPEVEVTRRGIAPHIEGGVLQDFIARRPNLRWPIPPLGNILRGEKLLRTARRGKYLLLEFAPGWVIIHLGMSGHLRVLPNRAEGVPAGVHDHVDFVFTHQVLRLRDPRRFGAVLWHAREMGPIEAHPQLAKLGSEPFDLSFDATTFYQATRSRHAPIKNVLLAGDVVVGAGNIYASESLFRARIHPQTKASRISQARYAKLLEEVRATLAEAIQKGGSSLRDFVGADGNDGYFQIDCFVYDRAELPCKVCKTPIKRMVQGQRATFYCPHCQR